MQRRLGGKRQARRQPAALRLADQPRQPGRPVALPHLGANQGLAAHIEAVTNVRLLLERELRLGAWECERAIAQSFHSRSEIRPHLPDAVLVHEQERIAIEVELSLKSRARLDAIVRDLGESYEQVWYFAAPRLMPALQEIASLARWQNVTVHRYPPIAAERSIPQLATSELKTSAKKDE